LREEKEKGKGGGRDRILYSEREDVCENMRPKKGRGKGVHHARGREPSLHVHKKNKRNMEPLSRTDHRPPAAEGKDALLKSFPGGAREGRGKNPEADIRNQLFWLKKKRIGEKGRKTCKTGRSSPGGRKQLPL